MPRRGVRMEFGSRGKPLSHLEAAVDLERRMRARPLAGPRQAAVATALLGRGTPLDRPRSTRRRSSTPPEGP